jgi:predicted PurR-regulated permease PerM
MDTKTKLDLLGWILAAVLPPLVSAFTHWITKQKTIEKIVPPTVQQWLNSIDPAVVEKAILEAQALTSNTPEQRIALVRNKLQKIVPDMPSSVANYLIEAAYQRVVKGVLK